MAISKDDDKAGGFLETAQRMAACPATAYITVEATGEELARIPVDDGRLDFSALAQVWENVAKRGRAKVRLQAKDGSGHTVSGDTLRGATATLSPSSEDATGLLAAFGPAMEALARAGSGANKGYQDLTRDTMIVVKALGEQVEGMARAQARWGELAEAERAKRLHAEGELWAARGELEAANRAVKQLTGMLTDAMESLARAGAPVPWDEILATMRESLAPFASAAAPWVEVLLARVMAAGSAGAGGAP